MAADLDLVFGRVRYTGGPLDLVFGGSDEAPPINTSVTGTFQASSLSVSGMVRYDNRNPRRVSVANRSVHEVAAKSLTETPSWWGLSGKAAAEPAVAHGTGSAVIGEPSARWAISDKLVAARDAAWALGKARSVLASAAHEAALRVRAESIGAWEIGSKVHSTRRIPHQSGLQRRSEAREVFERADPWQALAGVRFGRGRASPVDLLAPWGLGRPIPPGLSVLLPGGEVLTPREIDLNLVFCRDPYTGGPINLVFGRTCGSDPVAPGDTIVVPVRSVYMTINNFSLVRLDNGYPIHATTASLALDVDSWTWSVSFSVNGSALPTVERNVNGDPVVARASINGTPIDFLLESIGRERTFGSNQLRVQGRGLSAQLDSPYAPTQFFRNTGARTARQLLDDILTLNGESIGWGIDLFQPTDWLVPANVFSHAGSYITAINAVVNSVGGYLQPKDTGQNMDVRLRYPTPSWEWSSATPDLVLPSAVTSREAIEWVSKAEYNRVYVSGQEGGVSGPYTRAGTAGDLLAPGVVDPLITHVDAVRQRGRTVISDTGHVANVTLRLPVLSETGIIRPGHMVQYTDGGETRIGMSRSVSVDVSMPTIYQSILVETHV